MESIKPSNRSIFIKTELAEPDRVKIVASDPSSDEKRVCLGAIKDTKEMLRDASSELDKKAYQNLLDDLLLKLAEQ